jgi:hypothetical protein
MGNGLVLEPHLEKGQTVIYYNVTVTEMLNVADKSSDCSYPMQHAIRVRDHFYVPVRGRVLH